VRIIPSEVTWQNYIDIFKPAAFGENSGESGVRPEQPPLRPVEPARSHPPERDDRCSGAVRTAHPRPPTVRCRPAGDALLVPGKNIFNLCAGSRGFELALSFGYSSVRREPARTFYAPSHLVDSRGRIGAVKWRLDRGQVLAHRRQVGFVCEVFAQASPFFAQGAGEIADVQTLRAKLAAGETLSPLQLIAVAAYVPLYTVEGAEKLPSQTWPEPIAPLLAQQIAEPLAERALRVAIPHMTWSRSGMARSCDHPSKKRSTS
jgi:hypothetical protein